MTRLMDVIIAYNKNLRFIQLTSKFMGDVYHTQIFTKGDSLSANRFYFIMRDRSFRLFLKKKRMDTAPYFFFVYGFYESWNLPRNYIFNKQMKFLA